MNEDGKVIPGPHHLADILRCKVEASQALATFQFARDTTDEGGAASDGSEHSPGQGRDRQRTAALTIHQTEQRYHGILSDIAQLRRDGGIFPCSFRAGQFADGDAIVVTRQGRFIMTQGHDLSVILPDELLAVTNKVARFRRGGYQRREAEHSYAFQISWVRVRPDQPPMPTRTQVFMEEHGVEFEAVARQVLGRRRQHKWRQIHALAAHVVDLRTTFSLEREPHRHALFLLWARCFPGVPPPPLVPKGAAAVASPDPDPCARRRPSWALLGLPTEAPDALLGIAGCMGIKQLLYYAETRPRTVQAILRSDLQLCIIGVTISQSLAMLGFDSGSHREPLPIAKPEEGPSTLPLARMLHNVADPTALEQVYCLMVDIVVDELWQHHDGSMSALTDVALQVKRSLNRCLDKLPTSIEELTVMMHTRQRLMHEAPDSVMTPERA
eukprot:m.104031 g.104031  ORF g.104031 m.104031 type:complete len:441 (-) comp10505_c0_seq3:96-1418(-)